MTTALRTINDLHGYQSSAIGRGLKWPQSALFLDLGLGKTIVCLTVIQRLLDRAEVFGVLVVAPVRVCEAVWRQEAAEWAHTSGLTFSLVRGTPAQREAALHTPAQVYLINYEGLSWLMNHYVIKRRIRGKGQSHKTEIIVRPGMRLPFDMIVLDEISRVANSTSQMSKALLVFRLLGRIGRWMGLTATPATNGLMKLHGEYLCLDGGELLGVTKGSFQRQYFYINFDGKLTPFPGSKDAIFRKVQGMTYAVDKDDHLQMPELIIRDVRTPLPDGLQQAYNKLETDFFATLPDGKEIEAFNAASMTNKCLQFVNGTVYDVVDPEDEDTIHPGRERSYTEVHEEKLKALDELIEELEGNPVLVTYPFRMDRFRMVARYTKKYRIADVQEYKNADYLLADWNSGRIDILLGHGRSMGHGLNLQKVCNHLIFYGLTWDLELYDQTIGRLHRQGQKEPVIVHRIMCPNTFDDVQNNALKRKARTQTEFLNLLREYNREKQQ